VTTSGTATFNLNLSELVEEAFERCGAELRTGYDLRTARRSLNLLFADWANRGVNMWTIEQGSIDLVQGTHTYDLPDGTVDLLEHVIRTNAGNTNNQADLTITRISVSTYASIPNKLVQDRPIQVYIDRRSGATYPDGAGTVTRNPTITVWPVPNLGTVGNPYYTFVYWRLRRVEDAGTGGTKTMDVPFRFLPCLVAGLAYYLSFKVPGGMERMQTLKSVYDEAWQLAAGEDQEKAAIRFVPRYMPIASG
jgi:hypothetical protein